MYSVYIDNYMTPTDMTVEEIMNSIATVHKVRAAVPPLNLYEGNDHYILIVIYVENDAKARKKFKILDNEFTFMDELNKLIKEAGIE